MNEIKLAIEEVRNGKSIRETAYKYNMKAENLRGNVRRAGIQLRETPKTTYIYAVIHPKTREIVYIGKANNLKLRIYQHQISPPNYYFEQWIFQLKKEGLIPLIEQVEEVDYSEWREREKFWIKRYTDLGYKLFNIEVAGWAGIKPLHKQ